MGHSLRFDYAFAAVCGVFLGGLYLDGWAHNHIQGIETFYTPWHAIMYAGFLGVLALTAVEFGRGRASGRGLRDALPTGYGISLLGMIGYGIAGVGDLIWHTIYGIESTVEALFSPTHIGLLVGATLIRTGPLRAAWQRPDPLESGWRERLPMVLSATYLLCSLTFFTQYVAPLGLTPASLDYEPTVASVTASRLGIGSVEYIVTVGVASIFVQTALLMAVLLLLVRRWGAALPFGTVTLIVAINAALMVVMRDRYLSSGPIPLFVASLAAGVVGDLLLRSLRPTPERVVELRTFAFVLPFVQYAFYFAALFTYSSGVWWTAPVWTGVVVLAGGVGWLVSFLILPPPVHVRGTALSV
jgi:hypothetical protein